MARQVCRVKEYAVMCSNNNNEYFNAKPEPTGNNGRGYWTVC